ncbi:UpxY family transcription antiterminator [Mucilaginibacter yixingensis]|nr:UpxY family transcription antiterminator [Mucilaginibacter yixingensis]
MRSENGGMLESGLELSNGREILGETIQTEKWYPVYTHPRAEKKAYLALTQKGINTYLPLHKQLKQWSDRKKIVEEPLIKSYLFVKISPQQQAEVLMTKGIARFLYFSGKIATMPDRQIDDLKLLMVSAVEVEVTEENLVPGEKVKIKAGPLKGMLAEVVEYRSQRQLALRFEDMGCCIIIHVAASYISRI